MYEPCDSITGASQALKLLKDGNERYVQGKLSRKEGYAAERADLAGGQRPFAAVLTCSDSRTPPEIFFDQRLGDIFVVRNAGNVACRAALGSIEYAVGQLGTTLIAVVGHSMCGAVAAARGGSEIHGELEYIIGMIRPACAGAADMNEAVRRNIRNAAEEIRGNEVVRRRGAVVAEGYYDIREGIVTWL
ncbi:MAG: carbonic anhydrase [Defluviitaleaceae bacterium]|nr:carbonic anhydrase [Defluviitaleaceae bacterium]